VHLASFSARSASYAFVGIDDRVIVGVDHRVFYAPFVDSPEYAARAGTRDRKLIVAMRNFGMFVRIASSF